MNLHPYFAVYCLARLELPNYRFINNGCLFFQSVRVSIYGSHTSRKVSRLRHRRRPVVCAVS